MNEGFVALVGAGPGDMGLLTLRAKELLEEAQVVVYDRLVEPKILSIAKEDATFIDVGKTSGHHPVPQDEINEILLNQAKLGRNVVRLKGGDPYVFGRGGEELQSLIEGGIRFEVVPGITSAVAAASFAGIPVTHRGRSGSLHIITAHNKKNEPINIDFSSLVKIGGTMVFLMGVSEIKNIADGLLFAGIDANTPAAIVQNGTRPNQRKVVADISTIESVAKENNIASPAVIIVGDVCALDFDWFTKRELFGETIIVTRPKESGGTLSAKLQALGADVRSLPCTKISKLGFEENVAHEMQRINDYDYLVFTSKHAVKLFFDYLYKNASDARTLANIRIGAVGKMTAEALMQFGIRADIMPTKYDAKSLATCIISEAKSGDKALLLRAKNGTEHLKDMLEGAQISVTDIALYETVSYIQHSEEVQDVISSAKNRVMVAFTSASTVDGFMMCMQGMSTQKVMAIAIGEETAKRCIEHGLNTKVCENATIESMIECIKETSKL